MTQAQPITSPLTASPPAVFEPAVTFEGGDILSHFAVARSPDEVVHAWRLVYESYLQNGLIDANPVGLHTVPQALHGDTVVIFAQEAGRTRASLTVICDGRYGLPLDRVYADQLNSLRSQGRRLVEVGLLADLRVQVGPSTAANFGMMCLAFHRAAHLDADIVIGVHPRHAAFYIRMVGFEIIGPVSTHPTVNDRPVVPLRINPTAALQREKQPRLLRFFANNPVRPEVFEPRCDLQFSALSQCPVHRFMAIHHGQPAIDKLNNHRQLADV